MQTRTANAPRNDITWTGVKLEATETGFRVYEDAERFRGDVRAEMALRFSGSALLLANCLMWVFLPAGMLVGSQGLAFLVTVVLGGAGVLAVLTASTGFRRELRVDARRGELRLMRLNAMSENHLRDRIAMKRVESLCVRRLGQGDNAELLMRLVDGGDAIVLMRGPEDELKALNHKLRRAIGDAQAQKQVSIRPAPKRRITPRRPDRPLTLAPRPALYAAPEV